MTSFAQRPFARLAAAAIAAACLALAGCAAPAVDPIGEAGTPAAVAAATSALQPALRCMDGLLLDHGVRDLSVIVEDLTDAARKPQAGAKEMLVSALSDMTQRSRAVRLVASGADWNQTVNMMTQAGKRDAYALAPQFALRGAVSRSDGGASGVGFGLDLTLLTTQDMSVVPGTATHNEVRLRQGGAEFSKFGQPFSVTAGSQAGALRTLVELASIELVGKLTKVPYWTCVGLSASNEAVTAEMQDWYDGLAARPAEMISYFQQQLRQRQAYDGPIDGTVNAAFKDAVARSREALGLPREPKLSLDFFKAYLGADSATLNSKLRASAPPAAAPGPAAPLGLRVAALNDARRFARGESVQLSIRTSRDAHVYCFLQDEKRQITRFFPNRFQRDSRVLPDAGLQLPGAMRFQLLMNPQGVPETVTCFATERDVLPELPPTLNAGDFNPLPVASLDQVRSAFVKASGGTLAHESFELRVK